MTMIKKLLLSFLFLALPVLSYASSSAGTTVVPFLKYGAGARAAGMGSAFSAVTGAGADMVYWNPAGIASSDRKDISLMYLSGLEGISYGWASYAMPSLYGSFGFALQYMSSGNIEGTGSAGEAASDFSTYDLALSLSYARYYDFGNAGILDYGVNLKYIYSKIDASANAFAADAGAIFTLNDDVTSFGVVMQNAGTSLKYNEENEVLPFVVRAGVSRIFMESLLVTADINFPNDNDVFASFGAEYSIDIMQDSSIAIRAGYDGRQKDIDGFSSLNAGFGLKYRDYLFDYAFSPYGVLGDVHRVSLGIIFGDKFDEESAKKERERKKRIRAEKRKAAEEAEKQKQERETEARLPEGVDENYNRTDFGTDESVESYVNGENDQDAQPVARPVRKNIRSVAVIDFVSADIAPNERGVYSEMLRKNLFETGAFSAADASKIKSVYSANRYPENSDVLNVFKFTKAKDVIACTVSKKGDSLIFDITVYDDKLKTRKYTVTSKDSFRYANEALKKFAMELSEGLK